MGKFFAIFGGVILIVLVFGAIGLQFTDIPSRFHGDATTSGSSKGGSSPSSGTTVPAPAPAPAPTPAPAPPGKMFVSIDGSVLSPMDLIKDLGGKYESFRADAVKTETAKTKAEKEAFKITEKARTDAAILKAEAQKEAAEIRAEAKAELAETKAGFKEEARTKAFESLKDRMDEWTKKNKDVDKYLAKMRDMDMKDAEQRRIANSVEYKRIEKEVERERENFQTLLANETARHEREMDEIQDSSARKTAIEAFNKWSNARQNELDRRLKPREEKLKKFLQGK